MNIDDLFDIPIKEEEPNKMTIAQFVEKTRAILVDIDKAHSQACQWRILDEDECDEERCNNCNGKCSFEKNGINYNCVADKLEGYCTVFDFQYETFVDEIENIMIYDNKYSFYELLSCEVVNDIE